MSWSPPGDAGRGLIPGLHGYTDLQLIAHGSTAMVFRATQTRLNRTVAIKVLLVDDVMTTAANVARELETTVALSSQPHIVSIIDTGVTDDGSPYIVMEYCEGGSYAQILKRRGPLPVDEVLEVGIKIGEALHAAHEVGIIHRDVKPPNILRSRFGPALTDFGIARAADDGGIATSTLDKLTPHHASPEAMLREPQSGRSDLYSLASTMWNLLVGRPPFADPAQPQQDPMAFRQRVLADPVPRVPRNDVPEWLQAELVRAMAKRAAERHASAATFAEALRLHGTRAALALPWPVPPVPPAQPEPEVLGSGSTMTVQLPPATPPPVPVPDEPTVVTPRPATDHPPIAADAPSAAAGVGNAIDGGPRSSGPVGGDELPTQMVTPPTPPAPDARSAPPVSPAPVPPVPVSPAPVPPVPVLPPPAWPPLEPTPPSPVSGPPVSGPPVSGPPVSAPPVSGPPVSGPPVSAPPVAGPPAAAPVPLAWPTPVGSPDPDDASPTSDLRTTDLRTQDLTARSTPPPPPHAAPGFPPHPAPGTPPPFGLAGPTGPFPTSGRPPASVPPAAAGPATDQPYPAPGPYGGGFPSGGSPAGVSLPGTPAAGGRENRSYARPLLAAGVIGIALGLTATIGILAVRNDRDPGPTERHTTATPTPTGLVPSGSVRVTKDGAPRSVQLDDAGTSVTLRWSDSTGGRVQFIIFGARTGQQTKVMGRELQGQTSHVIEGLNPSADYCFVVAAAVSVETLASSDRVCTRRLGGPASPSVAPS